MELNLTKHNQRNNENRSIQGNECTLTSINLGTDWENFLQNVADRLGVIESVRNSKIQGLIQEVNNFKRHRLDTSNQRMLARTKSLEDELKSKLHELSNCTIRAVDEKEVKSGESLHAKRARPDLSPEHAHETDSYLSSQITPQKPVPQTDSRSVNLLLIGSEGNGKSATGNSILYKDAFKIYSSASTSSTKSKSNIAKSSTEVGELSVNVIDGPSIHHSEVNQEFLENIINSIEETLELCEYAFTAILIVLKMGIRFTKQEVETIKLIKSLLGQSVIKDYGICVVTHGDNFERDVEDAEEDGEALTFESWCRDQSGDVKSLFDECNFRCVLFDNKTKDVNKRQNQRLKLLHMVDPNKRYSKEEFVKAEGLKELTFKALLPQLEQQTKDLIDQISQQVEELDIQVVGDPNLYSSKMKLLLEKLQTQKNTLQEFGQSSTLPVLLSHQLTVLENNINSKIKQQEMLVSFTKQAASILNKESSLGTSEIRSNAGALFSRKPDALETDKLEKKTNDLFLDIRYNLQKDKSISKQEIYSLLERLKDWKERVETVGQNSSSANSILIRIAELEIEIRSKLNNALNDSQSEQTPYNTYSRSEYYTNTSQPNQHQKEEIEAIDMFPISAKDKNTQYVVVVERDKSILVAIKETWRLIRKTLGGYVGTRV